MFQLKGIAVFQLKGIAVFQLKGIAVLQLCCVSGKMDTYQPHDIPSSLVWVHKGKF